MASAEYESIKDELPIPQQKIPKGLKTKVLANHGYRYWKDMFNHRQLLGLGKLLNRIKEIEDENMSEIILLAFSMGIEANNLFCEYDANYGIGHLFKLHGFYPPLAFIAENRIFGAKYGARTCLNYFKQILKAKNYNCHPFDKYVEDSEL